MKKTITVAIPAYNEGANIAFLIDEILKQKLNKFKLQKVVVASDGSSDDTVKKVKSVNDRRVTVIANKLRRGAYAMQNQIFEKAESDIVILLNADVSLSDASAIETLANSLVRKKADLVAGQIVPLKPQNFLEQCLNASVMLKEELFSKYNNGKNVYSCHGPFRAFSKKLYKSIRFQKIAAEDAFSYFYTITNGFTYAYEPKAKCYYKVPARFEEHERQSIRFEKSKRAMAEAFGKDVSAREYFIPKDAFLKALITSLLKSPFYLTCFIGINILTKIKAAFSGQSVTTWEMVQSSKILHK
jgi:glycosyltransferase involved in cell wall biosynthesis